MGQTDFTGITTKYYHTVRTPGLFEQLGALDGNLPEVRNGQEHVADGLGHGDKSVYLRIQMQFPVSGNSNFLPVFWFSEGEI